MCNKGHPNECWLSGSWTSLAVDSQHILSCDTTSVNQNPREKEENSWIFFFFQLAWRSQTWTTGGSKLQGGSEDHSPIQMWAQQDSKELISQKTRFLQKIDLTIVTFYCFKLHLKALKYIKVFPTLLYHNHHSGSSQTKGLNLPLDVHFVQIMPAFTLIPCSAAQKVEQGLFWEQFQHGSDLTS